MTSEICSKPAQSPLNCVPARNAPTSVPGSPNTGPLLKNGRKAGATFATEAFFGASASGAFWAYVGETATSIDRESATSVLVPAGAKSACTVTESARAAPQMGAEMWNAYPLLHQQLAQRALRLTRSFRAALRMGKQMCVRTLNALALVSGAWLFGFGEQREQKRRTSHLARCWQSPSSGRRVIPRSNGCD